MTLQQRITLLAQAIGDTCQQLNGKMGALVSLNTADKTSLVNSINELKTAIDAINNNGVGVQIDDVTASGTTTYSSNKINTAINAAIAALVAGSPTTQDTLLELANQITALAQADNGLVSTAAVQGFSAGQKLQARQNIDAASVASVTAVTDSLGNTDYDFVNEFNTAYTT